MEFNQLSLEKVVFEVKYVKGYMYLDNSGKILNSILDKYPTLKHISSAPLGGTSITMSEHSINIIFSHERITVEINYPDNLKFYRELTNEVIQLISRQLQITTFTRVGNRFFYIFPIESVKANEIFRAAQLFTIPEEKLSIFGKTFKEPEMKFVAADEDEGIGYKVRVSTFSRVSEVTRNKPLKIEYSKLEETGILVDIDFFTSKSVDLSILNCDDLIRTNEHRLSKMIPALFKEKRTNAK